MIFAQPLSATISRSNQESNENMKENEAKAARLAADKKAEEVMMTAREKAIVEREEKIKEEKEKRKRERNQIEYDIKVAEEKAWVVKENQFLEKQRADRAEIERREKVVTDEVQRKNEERDNQMCNCPLAYFSAHRYCLLPNSLPLTLPPYFPTSFLPSFLHSLYLASISLEFFITLPSSLYFPLLFSFLSFSRKSLVLSVLFLSSSFPSILLSICSRFFSTLYFISITVPFIKTAVGYSLSP
jgi:hypothetical protein